MTEPQPPGDDRPVPQPPASAPVAPTTGRPPGLEVARRAFAAARAEIRRQQRGGQPTKGAGLAARAAAARRAAATTRSGSGPDERDPQRLESTIGRLLREQGWETDAAVGSVTARWAEIVGPEVAAHAQPTGYADGRLEISADSSAWATQLRLLAPALVRRLNEEAGEGTVRIVEVRGPSAPSWRRGLRSVKGRGPRDTYG